MTVNRAPPPRPVWGPPKGPGEAIRVLRRAIELGVHLIDTAGSYGPYVAGELIREALSPYLAQFEQLAST